MPAARETRSRFCPCAFEWRAPIERARWLLLGALGLNACAEENPSRVEPRSSASACEASSSIEGGLEQCQNGMLHRPAAAVCTSLLPRPRPAHPLFAAPDAGHAPFMAIATLECVKDGDCMAAPYGQCDANVYAYCVSDDASLFRRATPLLAPADAGSAAFTPTLTCVKDSDCASVPDSRCVLEVAAYCRYGCVSDDDCVDGQVCLCGEVIGECVPASCRTDADCGPASLCGSYGRCSGVGFSCQRPEDECSGDADCPSYEACMRRGDTPFSASSPGLEEQRTCFYQGCAVPGRPFLIGGAAQQAHATVRGDWYPSSRATAPASLVSDPDLRSAIARGWTAQALMEHASVAAFARFSLQLLQLGAPAELVSAASQAMADEIRHARACFELARRHGDGDVGPGPLDVTGVLSSADLTSVVLDTVREGCIGETLAALEAAEALEHCEDPAARPVLQAIAQDELAHAELAWRFVAWALDGAPASLHAEVCRAFADATVPEDRAVAPITPFDGMLARHGLLGQAVRSVLSQRVLAEVVAPCAQVLLQRAASCAAQRTAIAQPACERPSCPSLRPGLRAGPGARCFAMGHAPAPFTSFASGDGRFSPDVCVAAADA